MREHIESAHVTPYNTGGGDEMKITVNKSPDNHEMEVVINCKNDDAAVRRIVSAIYSADSKLLCYKDDKAYRIDSDRVLYIESVNRKTFLYTEDDIYEIGRRLYELEEHLRNHSFFRASKAIIINLNRVHSLRPEIGSRLIVTMDNEEKIVVSRQYAGKIKNALGVR